MKKVILLGLFVTVGAVADSGIKVEKRQQNYQSQYENKKNEISIAGGAVYNVPLPLKIRQDGSPTLKFTAKYDTKPFDSPPYYQIRYSRWNKDKAWEFEMIHHKLYLSNKPNEIQEFTITNGYNLLLINRAFRKKFKENIPFIYRIGFGPVITHPESTIRGKKFDEKGGLHWVDTDGYFVSGIVGQLAVELDYIIYKSLAFFVEGKIMGSFATVPIHSGRADLSNISFHSLFGLKYAF